MLDESLGKKYVDGVTLKNEMGRRTEWTQNCDKRRWNARKVI